MGCVCDYAEAGFRNSLGQCTVRRTQ
ncbi:hypothetical protein XPR_4260, partial [Xanthomonas arboricola pv. pruni MAFF 301420]